MNNNNVYREMVGRIMAIENCKKAGDTEWEETHNIALKALMEFLPHGSGIDAEWTIDDKSSDNKLILHNSYHVMDDSGFYTRWVDFTANITPSLQFGYRVNITGNFGRDQDLKDYLIDVMHI